MKGASKRFRLPKAILFDLDGTLIDSAPDIAAAVNELLAGRDLPPLKVDQIRAMIGGGVMKLVERAFAASGSPLAGSALEEANRDMAPIYRRHLTGLTRLMPGVRETLTHFHLNGTAMGVVTNKPQLATREILLHFHLTEYLGAIVGGDAVTKLKPAPDALLLALDQLQAEPYEALMVGDSVSDVGAARATGMPVALLRGGYTQVPVEELGADLVCDSLLDLPSAMQRLQAAA
ncbi:phosphoglycolate phosphatase [Mesorhizobium sp. M2C.T.Ca.TU.002.02.1.1]|uniref:phosphoglycolate phosphatase n=1 Tax=Mesorhizobium sp. M2C.T.Ca.TU.002.02.1.1 TaxID=2496788 RepID=UPI000FCB4393|nr:phosphoglycolate phosphatase [Mesorhizobium sp. M2C.T.Ca.TU.002.02.1.1]RUU58994.1 phosphoglycolate phosphatase [Mesorhizobium sp. M2C.T.Ca.TU.002.02.1.1]